LRLTGDDDNFAIVDFNTLHRNSRCHGCSQRAGHVFLAEGAGTPRHWQSHQFPKFVTGFRAPSLAVMRIREKAGTLGSLCRRRFLPREREGWDARPQISSATKSAMLFSIAICT
jgi:hypothetical protein